MTDDHIDDRILIAWIAADVVWGMFVFGTISYAVFWNHQSGWWFVLGYIFCSSPNLFKVLRKRYGILEQES